MHFLTELNRIVQVSRLTVFKSLLVTESKTVGISLAYSLERREIVELRAAAREPAETWGSPWGCVRHANMEVDFIF